MFDLIPGPDAAQSGKSAPQASGRGLSRSPQSLSVLKAFLFFLSVVISRQQPFFFIYYFDSICVSEYFLDLPQGLRPEKNCEMVIFWAPRC